MFEACSCIGLHQYEEATPVVVAVAVAGSRRPSQGRRRATAEASGSGTHQKMSLSAFRLATLLMAELISSPARLGVRVLGVNDDGDR